jgi:Ca-activated chloride channel family protein
MVVAERYVPGKRDTADEPPVLPDTDESNAASAPKDEPVPDANRITPAVMPKGMRAGHDISIDVTIDAGVPLIGFHSQTHQIEALQPGVGRATVRLQDQAVIPNKDFVLKYDVGGTKIEDALLTYRKSTDGFLLSFCNRLTASRLKM